MDKAERVRDATARAIYQETFDALVCIEHTRTKDE